MHNFTSSGQFELRVDMTDINNRSGYALYSNFSVGGESDGYRLHVTGYSGDAGDALDL